MSLTQSPQTVEVSPVEEEVKVPTPAVKQVPPPPNLNMFTASLVVVFDDTNEKFLSFLDSMEIYNDKDVNELKKQFSEVSLVTDDDEKVDYNFYNLLAKVSRKKQLENPEKKDWPIGPFRKVLEEVSNYVVDVADKNVVYVCNKNQIANAFSAYESGLINGVLNLFSHSPETVVLTVSKGSYSQEFTFGDFISVSRGKSTVSEELGRTIYDIKVVITINALALYLARDKAKFIFQQANLIQNFLEIKELPLFPEIAYKTNISSLNSEDVVDTLTTLVVSDDNGFAPFSKKDFYEIGEDDSIFIAKTLNLPQETFEEDNSEK